MKIKILTLIVFAFFVTIGFSQKNISLYNLQGTPQALYTNPAFIPKAKFYLSLPMGFTSFGVSNSAFSFNDLFTKRSDDSLVMNPEKVVNQLDKTNMLSFESSIELFAIGLKVKDINFNFSVNNKFQANFIYPKDMMQLALEGNGKNFIGKRVSMDGLGINVMDFTEFAFGFSKEINDKLTVGGKLKLLSGVLNIRTKKSVLGIYTDPETFDLTLDGSAEINTSNMHQFYSDSMIDQTNPFPSAAFNFRNKGLGLDLGATFKLNDKVTLKGSIIDLGSIKWSNNVQSYKSNDINYTFRGVNLNDYFTSDTTKNGKTPQENFADTLPKIFNYQGNQNAYTTSLYTKFYLGASYELNKNLNVGGLLLSEFVKGKYKPAIAFSLNASLKSWLTATVNYSIYNKTYTNVGLGVSMKAGPVQFIIMTDNVFGFINVLNARSVNLSTGLSILIGDKKRNKKSSKVNEGVVNPS